MKKTLNSTSKMSLSGIWKWHQNNVQDYKHFLHE